VTPAGDAVIDLSDVRITDLSRVGPKIARLGQLASAGWRVPDGYAVTVDALGKWLPAASRSELARILTGQTSEPATLGQLSARAQALIESQPLPSWLEDAVFVAHERLRLRTGLGSGLRVAVRSSAVAEDGAGASFAGQFSTYLGIGDIADVLHHIRKCWASGYTARALEYRRRAGQPLHSDDLAVGVMQLLDVRSAGVLFTLDPVTSDRDRMVVEANWGFGESVVSGHTTPDHWEVERATGRVLVRRVGAKRAWSVFDPAADRVILADLPADLAGRACLDDDELRYLCRQAAQIEDAEGVPQDIEWAIARMSPFPANVFILQHRPETTWAAPAAATASTTRSFDPVQYALRTVFRVPGT
jgi:pyruvate,water dikinase